VERYRSTVDPDTGRRYLPVRLTGTALLRDPILNKGTAFSEGERDRLDLRGLLPPHVTGLPKQVERAYENYQRQPDDLAKYLYLISLQDRNETLFYRLVLEHLPEMVPIVYTPTVGLACQKFSHIYRRPRGLYITRHDCDRMHDVLANAPFSGVAVIVATDNEGILGIGDQGAGGMGIPIGKLALYTLGAGIHPARCLAVCLDVGTKNPTLRNDPLYLGVREERLVGDQYLKVVDAFVNGLREVFPSALLQWEDFSRQTAWTVLNRHRDTICSFNDDIQGTGAMVLAGVLALCRAKGEPLTTQRIVIHGTGAAGSGIANVLRSALAHQGLNRSDVAHSVIALDKDGLIVDGQRGLEPFQRELATPRELLAGWTRSGEHLRLLDVVRNYKPTVLIGTCTTPGEFSEAVVREMARHVQCPGIFALSNPTSKTEVHPKDALRWTEGRALVVTGSPFEPIDIEGQTRVIGQANNVLCFPGIGLGVIATRATRVTDTMLLAAASAVAEQLSNEELRDGNIYPAIRDLRQLSKAVANAVARAAVDAGVADPRISEGAGLSLEERIEEEMWYPDYLPYH
jgi:malate dehydrogenase (oxaloacetate-decarboxylating)